MPMLRPLDLLVFVFCIAFLLVYRHHRRARPLYPPGLPRLPFIGSVFSIPSKNLPVFYQELGEKLRSNIIYLEALGYGTIVLNDVHIARDLLEARSALYSSRPRSRMLLDVVKFDAFFVMMPYGDEWRNHRRLFQQHFSPKLLAREQEKELEFVRKALLPNIYRSPHDVHEHILNCVGSLATAITYGLQIQRNHDNMVQLAEDAFATSSRATSPGKYLVEIMPILRHVPEWMPGAGFKRFARESRAILNRVLEEPYQATLKAMEDGVARDSFVSTLLERYSDRSNFENQAWHIKRTASQVHGAATETTASACMTFLLAMLTHLDIQRKAQQEIDSVVGHDRLPDFSDKQHLPYLSAILKEVLRWNPVLPLGVPHLASEEDVYEGYYIPKGTIVIANAYAMLHDENVFPDPKKFKPERFLENDSGPSDLPDPEVFATFGFGRRICPGSHIALSTLYLIAVSVLALFDVSPELDGEGHPIEVVPGWINTALASKPRPFPFQLTPRKGKDVEGLLREYMDVEVI